MKATNAAEKGVGEAAPPMRSSPQRPIEVFLAQRELLGRVAAGMGLRGTDIDDCLQDVSVAALKQEKPMNSSDDCARWLMRVTMNRCRLEFRRQRGFLRKAAEIFQRRRQGCANSSAKLAMAAEELERVRAGLKTLNHAHLAPMVLRYFCDMDATEIGKILELKPSTVRSRLREARQKLARVLVVKGGER